MDWMGAVADAGIYSAFLGLVVHPDDVPRLEVPTRTLRDRRQRASSLGTAWRMHRRSAALQPPEPA